MGLALKHRMRPDWFLLSQVWELERTTPIKIRCIRVSMSTWHDVCAFIDEEFKLNVFDNVVMLNEYFLIGVAEDMSLGPEFIDIDGNTFFDPEFSNWTQVE